MKKLVSCRAPTAVNVEHDATSSSACSSATQLQFVLETPPLPAIRASSLFVGSPLPNKAQAEQEQQELEASLLDMDQPNSLIRQSKLYGCYTLAAILVLGLTLRILGEKWSTTGEFIDRDLHSVLSDFSQNWGMLIAAIFGMACYWLLVAYTLQRLVVPGGGLCGISLDNDSFVGHACCQFVQSGLMVYGFAFVYFRPWPLVQMPWFIISFLIFLMKLHSYMAVNRELYHEYLKKLIDGTLTPEEQQSELCYPNNVSLRNCIDFMLVPSLVYQTYFPRIPAVRPWYLAQKLMRFGALFLFGCITGSHYLLPILHQSNSLSFVEALLKLMAPFLFFYLIIFLLLFETLTNIFAELCRIGDRRFYLDWWNSASFEEYARKWNLLVHNFLARHVYLPLKVQHKRSSRVAIVVTFFVSAVLHEVVLAACTRVIRPWFLISKMAQVPLILLGRNKFGTPNSQRLGVGNFLFWLCMLVGPATVGLLYAKSACSGSRNSCQPDYSYSSSVTM